MTTEEFNVILNARIEAIKETLGRKAKEYAHGDRLSNFKTAAHFQGVSHQRALQGMRLKHEVSIEDMISDIDAGCSPVPLALWQEKIGDSINYLILLEALVIEGREGPMETVKSKTPRR